VNKLKIKKLPDFFDSGAKVAKKIRLVLEQDGF
jgi:hypothetical protein